MPGYCVVSHDPDEQQAFFDVVTADTSETAANEVATMRDSYATVVDVLDRDALRSLLGQVMVVDSPKSTN